MHDGFFLTLMQLQVQSGEAAQIELSADGNIKGVRSNAYCGIYAAFGAASAVLNKSGDEPSLEFFELLTGEYVSSYAGSSTRDLLRAIEKLGCSGKAYQCLSSRSLEGSNCPMILHVSGRGPLGTYQHWVLFLGLDSGNAIIQDGEGGSFPMPISELLSRWDGKAIAVFPKGATPPNFFSWEIVANCILLGGVGFIVLSARSFSSSESFKSQLLAFLSLFGIAMVYCFTINAQVGVHVNVARAVKLHTDRSLVETLSHDDFQRRASDNDVTIVDCRYRTDYEYGYIPNAISIPIDVSQTQLLAISKKLSKESPIVLYCQSRGCQFSDIMAVELTKLGFTKLSIYRNGYAGWEAKSK